MDIQVQFQMPFNGWDILPSPYTPAERYEIFMRFHLPSVVAGFLGFEVPEYQEAPPEPALVVEARSLFKSGGELTLSEEGVGGTYFLKSGDSPVGIFKPSDEEPGGLNDPKGLVQTPLLPPGGGAARECAAFVLDRDRFAGVPETYLLSAVSHQKLHTPDEKSGSIQRFVPNKGDSSSYGTSLWSVENVHRIGILDIRIFNMDRNNENILVQERDDGLHLVPIDHTYSLPPVSALDGAYFEWQYWPQAKKPFSPECKAYVLSIDIGKDVEDLQSLGIPEDCIMTMVVTTMLLKEAISAGWPLYDIACLMARTMPLSTPSCFEEVISSCRDIATKRGEPFLEVYQEALQDLVSAKTQQLTPNTG